MWRTTLLNFGFTRSNLAFYLLVLPKLEDIIDDLYQMLLKTKQQRQRKQT